MTAPLTDNDKKNMLAGALRVRSYNIDDITDTDVYYTQEDPNNGNLRGTYQCSYSIADNKVTVGTPTQVIKRTVYQPLVVVSAFSLDGDVSFDGDTVIRTGKVFECGDYPDRGISVSEEDADAAMAAFTPVFNDLEHKDTILAKHDEQGRVVNGKLGLLSGLNRVGKELFGSITIPKWLHEAVGDAPIKTSLAWDTATKTIVGNGLVLNPRIADAQLVAAFNEASGLNSKEGISMPEPITMTRKTWWDKVKGLFSAGLPEGLEALAPEHITFSDDAPQPQKPVANPADAPTFSQPDPQVAVLTAKLAARDAADFADAQITAGKAFPAERDSLIAQFSQAAKDDGAGIACFASDGTTPTTRVALLQAGFAVRPAHNLTAEQLTSIDPANPPKLVVLGTSAFSDDNPETPTAAGKSMSEAREKRLAQFSGIKEGN